MSPVFTWRRFIVHVGVLYDKQGLRIVFQSEGAKIVLYLVLPEGPPLGMREGKISYFGSLGLRKCPPRYIFKDILFLCHE